MGEIADQVKARWPVKKIAMVHRKGVLQIGEVAVVVAVSTPHRKEAFEACQYTIDTLKLTVPIWKKEIYENGEIWVSAHPWGANQLVEVHLARLPWAITPSTPFF